MRALIDRFAAAIRRRLADPTVRISQLVLLLPEDDDDAEVRVRFHVENTSGHQSFVAVGNPAGRTLVPLKMTEPHAAVAQLPGGWSIEIPAERESQFELHTVWANRTSPLCLPHDAPEPVQALHEPKAIIPIVVLGGGGRFLTTGLAPSSWRQGYATVDVWPNRACVSVPLTGPEIRAHLMGDPWMEQNEQSQRMVLAATGEAFALLFSDADTLPKGSLCIELSGREYDAGIVSTVISLRREWLSGVNAERRLLAEIVWQLSGVMCAGLARIRGEHVRTLMFGIRLQIVGAAGIRAAETHSTQADLKQIVLNRLLRDLGSNQSDEVSKWYERALSVNRSLEARWRGSHEPIREVRQLLADLEGFEVDGRWFREQLRMRGIGVPER